MGPASEHFPSIPRGIDDQRFVTVGPVANFLTLQITLDSLPIDVVELSSSVMKGFSATIAAKPGPDQ
jgi:hypothetical protein